MDSHHHAAELRRTLDESLAAFDRITAEKLRLVPAPIRGQVQPLLSAVRGWMATASDALVDQRRLLDEAGDALEASLDELDQLD